MNPQQPVAPPARPKRRLWPWLVFGIPGGLLVLIVILAVATSGGREGMGQGVDAATSSTPATPSTPATAPAQPTLALTDAGFVESVKSRSVPFTDAAGLVQLGHMNCDSFKRGDGLLDIAKATITYSTTFGLSAKPWTPQQAGFVIGAAVVAYCPEYTDKLGN